MHALYGFLVVSIFYCIYLADNTSSRGRGLSQTITSIHLNYNHGIQTIPQNVLLDLYILLDIH